MTSKELRQIFLDFFKKRGHIIVPSSPLLPSDASVLFTTAGMQQFSLHLQGKKDPLKEFGARHLASCQKCFRSDDIEEIGDDVHHTFFEMLGNWSIGQDEKGNYFKEGAIKFAYELLISGFQLSISKLWITVFEGNKEIPEDIESQKIWQELGIPRERIKKFGIKDNLWGPVAKHGPCGPCSEIHYDRGEKFSCGSPDCGPNCPRCKRYVEIWNLVFMEYYKDGNRDYKPLSQKNVDTGMGLERVAAILQNKPSAYETDLFWPVIQELEKISSKKYNEEKRNFRIIADHIRGIVFLVSEGILPSNIEQGYVLRRVLRRAIRYGKILNLPRNFLISLAQKVIEIYKDVYPEVKSKETDILTVIQNEEEKFEKTLEKGLNKLKSQISNLKSQNLKILSGKIVFDLYQSYGFPLELTAEIVGEECFDVDKKSFEEEFKKHQEISRAGAGKKFGGGGEFSPGLHTATHLLHAALREILGKDVKQMGSDITQERLRFDFSFSRKLTSEELKKIEDLVNEKIKDNLMVKKEEMSYEKAIESGALAFFKEKYPKNVTVYSVYDQFSGEIFSKEICAGPHIERTGKLGRFKVVKEESSGAGLRRIKAVLEKD